jgi:hypothetical protein
MNTCTQNQGPSHPSFPTNTPFSNGAYFATNSFWPNGYFYGPNFGTNSQSDPTAAFASAPGFNTPFGQGFNPGFHPGFDSGFRSGFTPNFWNSFSPFAPSNPFFQPGFNPNSAFVTNAPNFGYPFAHCTPWNTPNFGAPHFNTQGFNTPQNFFGFQNPWSTPNFGAPFNAFTPNSGAPFAGSHAPMFWNTPFGFFNGFNPGAQNTHEQNFRRGLGLTRDVA